MKKKYLNSKYPGVNFQHHSIEVREEGKVLFLSFLMSITWLAWFSNMRSWDSNIFFVQVTFISFAFSSFKLGLALLGLLFQCVCPQLIWHLGISYFFSIDMKDLKKMPPKTLNHFKIVNFKYLFFLNDLFYHSML